MKVVPEYGFLFGKEQRPVSSMGFGAARSTPEAFEGYLTDTGDGHAMVFAPTGAGKKRNVLLPTLLTARNPAVVVDIKGELARESAEYRRKVLGHQVVVLDPWNEVGDGFAAFNPLDVVSRNPLETADDAYALARLLIDEAPLKEVYWDESSQAVIAGLIAHAACGEGETDRSFRRVWKLANGDDTIYQLALLLDSQKLDEFAKAQILGLVSLNADQTRSCILSVMHQHLRVFSSQAVQRVTETTTFDLDAVRSGAPLSVYIVVPPHRLKSHAALVRVWLAAFINLITQRRTAPPHPTLMLIDEAAQLGRMSQIPEAVTLARGYGMRCMLLWQSYAQLKHAYPTEAEVLMENSANLITFGHTAFSMSRQLADALGDISPERLFAMGTDELAVRRGGELTRIATRVDYLTDRELMGRAGRNPMFDHPASPRRASSNDASVGIL